MRSYFSLSNLFHLACLQDSFTFLQMVGFPHYLGLNKIPLYIKNTSSLDINKTHFSDVIK